MKSITRSPVSGCPIKRLEVTTHMGSKIQDASQFSQGLNLTLASESEFGSSASELVMSVCSGPRRLVSHIEQG